MEFLDSVSKLVTDQAFRTFALYLTTALGAAAMQVFSMNRGFEGSIAWLKRMWPGHSKAFYHRWDFILVVVIGSLIGYMLFRPAEVQNALAAGFGWVGAVSVFADQRPTASPASSSDSGAIPRGGR